MRLSWLLFLYTYIFCLLSRTEIQGNEINIQIQSPKKFQPLSHLLNMNEWIRLEFHPTSVGQRHTIKRYPLAHRVPYIIELMYVCKSQQRVGPSRPHASIHAVLCYPRAFVHPTTSSINVSPQFTIHSTFYGALEKKMGNSKRLFKWPLDTAYY